MNKAILLGRLTRDPELRFAAGSGTAVSRFTVAVNRQFKKDETDFINCIAFGKTAETISQYFTKGKQIGIVGHIQTGSYDKEGTKVYTTDVIVESFDFVDKAEGQASGNKAKEESQQGFNDGMEEVDNEDMPFN